MRETLFPAAAIDRPKAASDAVRPPPDEDVVPPELPLFFGEPYFFFHFLLLYPGPGMATRYVLFLRYQRLYFLAN